MFDDSLLRSHIAEQVRAVFGFILNDKQPSWQKFLNQLTPTFRWPAVLKNDGAIELKKYVFSKAVICITCLAAWSCFNSVATF